MTGLRPEGCGRLPAAGCVRFAQGAGRKVLRIDRPDGRRVLKFDGLSGRGLWYRPPGDEYKVSVTDSPFCVIWHDKHYADWLAALASPFPASPDFPRKRNAIKLREKRAKYVF